LDLRLILLDRIATKFSQAAGSADAKKKEKRKEKKRKERVSTICAVSELIGPDGNPMDPWIGLPEVY